MAQKILSAEEATRAVAAHKERGKTVVLCHGTFDVFHRGHLAHLREAKSYGDLLVVGVTADAQVPKGPGRPVFGENDRMDMLSALEVVDLVVLDQDVSAGPEMIRTLRPSVFVKGRDYAGQKMGPAFYEAARATGARLEYTEAPLDSSSRVSKLAFQTYSDETEAWLRAFKRRFSEGRASEALDRLRQVRVLVVGEDAHDRYVFVDARAAGPDEGDRSARLLRPTDQPGALLAIAGHARAFAQDVRTLSSRRPKVGEAFVRAGDASRPLFGTTDLADPFLGAGEEEQILARLDQELAEVDVVIAADYGYGLFTPAIRARLESAAKLLAVTVKGLRDADGFNLANKWGGVGYFALNDFEYALALSHDANWRAPGHLMVTEGEGGAQLTPKGGATVSYPSFAVNVVDPIGCGDALLALSASLLAAGCEAELAGFVGCCAAALQCQVEVNSKPIEAHVLRKFVSRLLL